MGVTASSGLRRDQGSNAHNNGRRQRTVVDGENDPDSLSSDNGSSLVPSGSGGVDASHTWSLVRSENLATWKYAGVLWGFDPRIDYTSNVKARLQPWCTAGRHLVVKQDNQTMPAHQRPHCVLTVAEGCFHQDTLVRLPSSYASRLHTEPDPAGHYLKSAQVVGYRDGLAVIQLNCVDNVLEFVALHMKTESILAVHKESTTAYGGKHYLCDCIISPDLSTFLLKPNAMYVLNFCRGEYHNTMKLLSCKDMRCPVIKTLFENAAVRLFVAFDPRYRNHRIALGNYPGRDGRDVICLYDLHDDSVIATSDRAAGTYYQTTHNITFSADGQFLASLVLGRSLKDGLFNFPRVIIYNGSNLSVVHSIRTEYLMEVPTLSPSALFPLFSATGAYLAVPYGEQGTFYQQVAGVRVYKVPLLIDLQSLCRLVIRQHFDCQDVERLPLPNKLKAYLRFQPSYG